MEIQKFVLSLEARLPSSNNMFQFTDTKTCPDGSSIPSGDFEK
jgi:hypothetical protein